MAVNILKFPVVLTGDDYDKLMSELARKTLSNKAAQYDVRLDEEGNVEVVAKADMTLLPSLVSAKIKHLYGRKMVIAEGEPVTFDADTKTISVVLTERRD